MPLSVSNIVNLAEKSQYLSALQIQKKMLFGGGLNIYLPQIIYTVRKSVNRIQTINGVRSETIASATITITSVPANGSTISVSATDAILGVISLGSYTKVSGDTTTSILAQSIATAISANSWNYTATVSNNVITIYVAPERGDSMNGSALSISGNIPNTATNFSGGIDESSGDPNLIKTANFLYWLCGSFALTAQGISGTGSVSPIASAPSAPPPYDFEVTNTSFIIAGQANKTISAFIGYNIQFYRNGQLQSTVNTGGTYYTWNNETGLLTLFGEAQPGEIFQIYPVT